MGDRTRQGRKTGKKRGAGKKGSVKTEHWRPDRRIMRKIRQEAEGLQLSEAEYLNLMVHVSEALRTASLPTGFLEGGFLKMLLENPLMLEMIKGMLRNMVSQFSEEYDQSSRSPQGMGGQYPGFGGPRGGPMPWQQQQHQQPYRPYAPMWPQHRPERMNPGSEDSGMGSLDGLTDLFSKLFGDYK